MKFIIVFLAVIAIVVANDDHYDIKYENFDVDTVIENIRLLESYTRCFMGEGKCPPEGKDMKKWIPEASHSACAKCTAKQKTQIAKVIKAIQSKLPKDWEILSKQNDPEGKYKEDLHKFIEEFAP